MNRALAYVIAAVLGAVLGAAAARALYPRTETKVQTKVETVVKKDVVTVVREVQRKDGTVERLTTTTDRTIKNKDAETSSKVTASTKADWLISGSVSVVPTGTQAYGLQINRRILGPVFVGGYGRTDGEVGALLTVEF